VAGAAADDGAAAAEGPLYPIGDAARLVGVSRALLRLWERERLIEPRRSQGGHRLYSEQDLRRLRQVARLRRLERLNAAAIRRELGPVAGRAAAAEAAPALGPRLRALRAARGWSLAAVAAKSGLSISFLSAVERGQANPSVGNLFKLADAYGTTVPGLNAPTPGVDDHGEDRHLLRPTDRPRYVAGGGRVVIEDLIAHAGALEAQRIEVLPGGGSEEAYAHPGEEFVFVLAGELTFWLGERRRYRLAAGDSLSFRSTRPHRWRNDGAEPAVLLWVNAPFAGAADATMGKEPSLTPRGGERRPPGPRPRRVRDHAAFPRRRRRRAVWPATPPSDRE